MLFGKGVRVITVGQQQHLDIHAFGQQHIRASHGSMDSRLVAII